MQQEGTGIPCHLKRHVSAIASRQRFRRCDVVTSYIYARDLSNSSMVLLVKPLADVRRRDRSPFKTPTAVLPCVAAARVNHPPLLSRIGRLGLYCTCFQRRNHDDASPYTSSYAIEPRVFLIAARQFPQKNEHVSRSAAAKPELFRITIRISSFFTSNVLFVHAQTRGTPTRHLGPSAQKQ